MKGTIDVNVDLVNASTESQVPSVRDFQSWAESALTAISAGGESANPVTAELSIRVIDKTESAELNAHYRHKQGPTNILSFPGSFTHGINMQESGFSLLGDLAICAPLVRQEAEAQDKTAKAHWAHLTVHGILHLKGYDHEEQDAAKEMEALEISILDSLGYRNPYTVS